MRISPSAVCVCVCVFLAAAPVAAATIAVPEGGNLQQAIDSASPGDTIALEPGATFTGNFTLPAKLGDAPITIRHCRRDDGLPADGGRISPAYAERSRSFAPAPRYQRSGPRSAHTTGGCCCSKCKARAAAISSRSETARARRRRVSTIAHDLVIDRLYIHGDAVKGQKRGIALNSASTTIPVRTSPTSSSWAGLPGHLRLEWTRALRDHQQLPRGGRRERDVRRQRSQRAGSGAGRHRGRPTTTSAKPRGVADGKLEREKPDRAQERAARDYLGQPFREQLGRRTTRVRDRFHRPQPGWQVRLVPGRSGHVRAEHRQAHRRRASRSSARTTTTRASRRRRS